MASGSSPVGGSPSPERQIVPSSQQTRTASEKKTEHASRRMLPTGLHRIAPNLASSHALRQIPSSSSQPSSSSSVSQPTSSAHLGTSSSIIPSHVKYEPVLPAHRMNAQVSDAMQTWDKILHPRSGPRGEPILYLRIDQHHNVEVCCCAKEVITGDKLRIFEQGQGQYQDTYYIYDPKEVAKRLSELELTRESCDALTPFVQSVEQLFAKGVRGAFRRARERLSGVVTKSVPTLETLTQLRPESKLAKGIVGIRGGLYQGITLTGPEGSSKGEPCCNDWVGIKPNGTIGVIDGPSHGRPELPARYFPIYQEVFETFDLSVEELRDHYENMQNPSDRQFEVDVKYYLAKAFLPFRQRINLMADQDNNLAGQARAAYLTSMRTLNESFCTPEHEVKKEDVVHLFGGISQDKLERTIQSLSLTIERAVVDSDEPNLDTLAKMLVRAEANVIVLEFYTALRNRDYAKVLEMREAILGGVEGIEPLIREETKELLRTKTGSAAFPEYQAEFLNRQLRQTLSGTFEAMLPSSDQGVGPALAFAKVINTKDGLFLIRVQSSDATCLTVVPGQLPHIDAELGDSTGFGGSLDGRETEVRIQRVNPGTIVSVQTDGVTDFCDLKALTTSVTTARDPQALYQSLMESMYHPARDEPRFCAIKTARGEQIPMRSLDVAGRDPRRVDDFSCVKMEIC